MSSKSAKISLEDFQLFFFLHYNKLIIYLPTSDRYYKPIRHPGLWSSDQGLLVVPRSILKTEWRCAFEVVAPLNSELSQDLTFKKQPKTCLFRFVYLYMFFVFLFFIVSVKQFDPYLLSRGARLKKEKKEKLFVN